MNPCCAAEASRTLNEGFQHQLEVEGRATDDLQDLARCRLLIQSLGEVTIAGRQFREEANVLDGDDGLIGERLQELDLFGREGPGCGASDADRSNGASFTQHRDLENASVAQALGRWAR